MVRIVQCLCPSRHCIMAIAYQSGLTAAQEKIGGCEDITLTEETASAWLKDVVEAMIATQTVNPWCDICKSRDFRYEDAKSIFDTIEQARAPMEALQEANGRRARSWGGMDRTE